MSKIELTMTSTDTLERATRRLRHMALIILVCTMWVDIHRLPTVDAAL